MRPEDMHPYIDAMAPVAVALGFFLMFLRAFKSALPFSIPLKFIAWLTGIVLGGCAVVALVSASPGGVILLLALVGLVVHVVRARLASAKAREVRAGRIQQARGHERRRAPPPLPPGGPGGAP